MVVPRLWRRSSRCAGIFAIIIATIVLTAIGVFAVRYYLNHLFGTRTKPIDISVVAHRTNVVFPSDAKLLNSLGIRHGIDFELYAKVEIDHNDVESFVAALKKDTGLVLSRTNRMHLSNSLRNWRNDTDIPQWWKPDSTRKFIACYSYMPLLLISLDNPDKAVVWVHWDTDGPPSSMPRK